MKTNAQITKDATLLKEKIDENVNSLIESKKADVNAIINNSSVKDAADKISELISSIDIAFSVYNDNIVSLPDHITRFTYSEDSISSITVTVRSKLKAEVKYVKKTDINVDENLVANISSVFYDALFEMYYITEANENIKVLNEVIDDICKKNNINYSFGFSVTGDSSSIVSSITNDSVIFSASVSKALDISSLPICQSGNEYNDYVHDEAIKELVDTLKTIQTTVQLIKSNVGIIKDITGVSTKKHASKIIRGAYHKNARYISKQKAGLAYFNEKVDINGEEVDVFAIVEKDANGAINVVLDPFDTKTLFNVDFDVKNALKEFA